MRRRTSQFVNLPPLSITTIQSQRWPEEYVPQRRQHGADDVTDLSGKLFAAGSGPPLSLLNQISELAYRPVSSKVAVMFPTA